MKFKFLKTIVFSIMFGLNSTASAGIIYDFDISSQTLDTSVDFTNYMIVAEFSDSTDFAAVTADDILNFGYNYAGVDYVFAPYLHFFDPARLFSLQDGHVTLTVGDKGAGDDAFVSTAFINNTLAQVGRGLYSSIHIMHGGDNLRVNSEDVAQSFSGVARANVDVPEPSTLAIFALGMIGLASRRFKKQS